MNKISAQPIALWKAILPILVLISLLALNVYFYGEDSSYGANQVALILGAAVAGLMGWTLQVPFSQMIEGVKNSINSTVGAILILLMIGALTGTWIISGIVPTMIYYGIDLLNPQIFLFACVVVSAIVSLATGSSWSTVATIGVAMIGIGSALGINEWIAAGAIISGAYFGDKMSPLSDTTNLAAAMAGTDLFTHIRYMMWTTVPSLILTLAIFLAIGFSGESNESPETPAPANITNVSWQDTTAVEEPAASEDETSDSAAAASPQSQNDAQLAEMTDSELIKYLIVDKFYVTPLLFIVPVIVIVMVMMKIDAVVSLLVGTLLGGLFAVIFQGDLVREAAGYEPPAESEVGESYATSSYKAVMNAIAVGTEHKLKEPTVKKLIATKQTEEKKEELQEKLDNAEGLFAGKGMKGMLNTVWLIITAMCFGGMMEATGLLRRLTEPLVNLAQSDGALVATTAGSCAFLNLTASDQYVALVVPGRMFKETYEERGLAPENLSRTLEDSGTVTSVLVPWNTCGATQASVLGVSVLHFAPYCFFNIISPLMTMLFAFLRIRIARLKND